ncbi:Fc.00g093290.m01.CDS01 [Cosmosporella sp. VM-42]
MRSGIVGIAVLALAGSLEARRNKCTPNVSFSSRPTGIADTTTNKPSETTVDPSHSIILSTALTEDPTSASDSTGVETSGIATGTSPSSSATGLPQTVTNLLFNGNFLSYYVDSPGGLYDYEITNQARQVSGQGYTGDGSQETGSCELVVDQAGVLDKRQVIGSGGTSSIQQWLDVPFGPRSLTLRLFYVVLANELASTCRLNVYFSGSLFTSTPYFDAVSPGNLEWGILLKQAAITTRSGYLKFELSCINGGAAKLLVDQAFVTNLVGPNDLSKMQLLWPVFDGGATGAPTTGIPPVSSTATDISTTLLDTTANPDTTIESTSVTTVGTEITQTSSTATSGSATGSEITTATGSGSVTATDSEGTNSTGSESTSSAGSNAESTTAIESNSAIESNTGLSTDSNTKITIASNSAPTSGSFTDGTSETMPTLSFTRNSADSATETTSTLPSTRGSTECSTDPMPTMTVPSNSTGSVTDSMPTMTVPRNSTESAIETMPTLSLTRNATESATDSLPVTSFAGGNLSKSATESVTSWTISVSGTVTPTGSPSTTIADHVSPTSLEDLSPGAREIYDYIAAYLADNVDDNGNVNVPNEQRDDDKELIPAPYNPDDTARQQELEDELERLGLPSPDTLKAEADEKVDNAEQGICPNDSKKRDLSSLTSSPLPRTKRQSRFIAAANRFDTFLAERDLTKRDAWDYICHDAVEAVMGVSETAEAGHKALCAGKNLYDSWDGIKCVFGGCGPTVLYETLTYTWNYEWILTFPSISTWLIKAGDANQLNCVDCSFKMSSIKFHGQIVVIKAQGQIAIKEATLIPEITGVANLVVELKTNQAWTSSWKYTMESASLATIQSDAAYSIKSRILYNMGVNFSADRAVKVKGGARFSLDGAKAELDMSGPTVKSSSGWKPSVNYVLPAFTVRGGVKLQPYMRWAVEFEVNIFNQVKVTPAITSYSMVTMKSAFSTDPQGSCPANKLAVSTFLTTANNMRVFDDLIIPLSNGDSQSTNQCFDMPELVPEPEEIQSLASVGGDFCTSYLYYQPPMTTTYDASTVYTPSTTITEKTTTTIAITTTKTETVTSSIKMTVTAQPPVSAVTITGAGLSAAFGLQNLKREEMTAAPLARREVATPAMVQNWDRTKISFACKQVATGSSTITQTVTTTTGSGSVVKTATITENENGPLITTTRTNVWAEYDGYTPVADPTSAEWAFLPTATACATPDTDSGKCFKIKVHGPDWVDGHYMAYYENGGFITDNAMEVLYFDTFYLADSGRLVTQDQRTVQLVMFAGYPWNTNYENSIFATEATRDITGHEYFLCSKDPDPCNKSLYCRTATRDGISFHFRPHVGGSVPGGIPATFTWEEAPCICGGTYQWQKRPNWEYFWEEGMDDGYWYKTD